MKASQPLQPGSALHRFHDLLLDDYSNKDDFLLALLELGRELLKMPCGIVSRIHGQDYEVLACSPASGELHSGAHFTMGRTFSSEALEGDGTVTLIAEPGVEGSFAHPAYTYTILRSFIGTPVRVRGRTFGTLDFCDTSDRCPWC